MLCELINLLEMLSSVLFVLFLVKCFHLATLIAINIYKISKLKKGENNVKN